MTYDIIKRNLSKLEDAKNAFPDILGKLVNVTNTTNVTEEDRLTTLACTLGLREYANFISWCNTMFYQKQSIVPETQMTFDELRSLLIDRALDTRVKEYLRPKTKRGFITFLSSEDWLKFKNDYSRRYGRRGRGRYYSDNFVNSQIMILHWLVQNSIDIPEQFDIPQWYKQDLGNFDMEIHTEISTTNDITDSIIKKIDKLEFDFRKLNYNLLTKNIEKVIKEKILSVKKDEKIKCIEPKVGLTHLKIYHVDSYSLNDNGSLMVNVLNDNNILIKYNYRIFENISRHRDKNIDSILEFLNED